MLQAHQALLMWPMCRLDFAAWMGIQQMLRFLTLPGSTQAPHCPLVNMKAPPPQCTCCQAEAA